MKIVYPREQVLSGVSLISSICSGRSTKQIYQCCKIIAGKDELQILGTDLDIAIRYKITGDGVNEPGEAAVPAAKLLNILKEISSDTVELVTDGQVCSIVSSDGKFKLLGDNPDEFPEIPDYGDEGFVTIDAGLLNSYAVRTAFAAARDMGRYAYNGILLEIRENGIKMAATDGRRLALAGNESDTTPPISTAIVPVKGLQQLGREFIAKDEELMLKIEKSQVIIKTAHVELAARLLEGEFPKYDDVIPKDHDKSVSANKEEIVSALRKAAITAGEEARSVRFSFKPGGLILSSHQEGVGEAEVQIPVEYEGTPFDITFNPDFVLEYLRVVEADKVKMKFKNSDSSGLLSGGDDTCYVIMPITSRS